MTISFTLPIRAIPKGRPRFVGRRVITPTRTRTYEAQLRLLARPHAPTLPLTCELSVTAIFIFKRPKKSKRPYPAAVGDTDNFFKAVSDAFNGLMWMDDSQITYQIAGKQYGDRDEIEIYISPREERP
jgi:Holliday junction resolvase RusA-like endonuclease